MNKDKNNSFLWKYAGLATQFFVAIAIAVYGGMQLDRVLKFSMPVAVWVLPLLFITGLIIKIIRDTTPKK
jgi:Mn2+/Fe2+ NRAMP family transporter